MKYKEFIEAVAKKSDTSTKHTDIVINAMFEVIIAATKKGDKIVTPYGQWICKTKPATPARKGMCPFTKVEKTFPAKPASKTPAFRPGKKYKEAIAKK